MDDCSCHDWPGVHKYSEILQARYLSLERAKYNAAHPETGPPHHPPTLVALSYTRHSNGRWIRTVLLCPRTTRRAHAARISVLATQLNPDPCLLLFLVVVVVFPTPSRPTVPSLDGSPLADTLVSCLSSRYNDQQASRRPVTPSASTSSEDSNGEHTVDVVLLPSSAVSPGAKRTRAEVCAR